MKPSTASALPDVRRDHRGDSSVYVTETGPNPTTGLIYLKWIDEYSSFVSSRLSDRGFPPRTKLTFHSKYLSQVASSFILDEGHVLIIATIFPVFDLLYKSNYGSDFSDRDSKALKVRIHKFYTKKSGR